MNKLFGLGAIATLTGLIACAAPGADTVGSADQNATADIDHMIRRPDGRFDVYCLDGTRQIGLTAEEINMNLACGGPNPHGFPSSSSTSSGSASFGVSSSSSSTSSSSSSSGGSSGAAATTCLDTTPIDATQLPYVKAKPRSPGACTRRELSDLGAYYKANAQAVDFTPAAWASSVSATCASCVFTSEDAGPAAAWGPIVTKDDGIEQINRGGCVEHVSGSEACGRTYQQYQGCLLQACLSECKTQADFTACRGDQRVLTTACKGAAEAVKSACGESNIAQYENACKGTTYTFEGPIKVACVNP